MCEPSNGARGLSSLKQAEIYAQMHEEQRRLGMSGAAQSGAQGTNCRNLKAQELVNEHKSLKVKPWRCSSVGRAADS